MNKLYTYATTTAWVILSVLIVAGLEFMYQFFTGGSNED